ncbi:PepSY domain-containing protein [Thalassotalea eurytherma]|uniref:PepSY domain-containing protein n=1 Tax=Thalassotalea eurytherma TaxID=1144278 RepID=A0ABQ6GZ69_9GAMM|nr:PepSY domain-containing protein [Thalassotalea eurytherma]GLX80614.1 hypothetical protein theurythT_00660 [Thalassotalea eurytherma]
MKYLLPLFLLCHLLISAQSYSANAPAVKSANQAAQIVKQRYGGKVLKVKSNKSKGSKVYKVKLIKGNGQVVNVSVYADTGRVKEH